MALFFRIRKRLSGEFGQGEAPLSIPVINFSGSFAVFDKIFIDIRV